MTPVASHHRVSGAKAGDSKGRKSGVISVAPGLAGNTCTVGTSKTRLQAVYSCPRVSDKTRLKTGRTKSRHFVDRRASRRSLSLVSFIAHRIRHRTAPGGIWNRNTRALEFEPGRSKHSDRIADHVSRSMFVTVPSSRSISMAYFRGS